MYVVEYQLGTKYIIDSLRGKFETLLQKALKDGETVDLRNCKFGPESAAVLRDYYSSVDMVNTTDSKLDALLKKNCEIARRALPEPYPLLNIPNNLTSKEFTEIFKSVKSGDKYGFSTMDEGDKKIATIVMLILGHPEVEFDINSVAVDVYEFVNNEWKSNRLPHDEYIEFLQPGIDYLTVDSKGYIESPTHGRLKAEFYIDRYMVLPADFGRVNLLQLESTGKPTGEWYKVIDKCIRAISRKPPEKKYLFDFLEFRE